MTNGETNLSESAHAMPGVPLQNTDTRRAQEKSGLENRLATLFRRAFTAIHFIVVSNGFLKLRSGGYFVDKEEYPVWSL